MNLLSNYGQQTGKKTGPPTNPAAAPPQKFRLPDTSAPGHFGTSTEWCRSVSRQFGTRFFTGAKLSRHFDTSAEIPRDTSAPSVKNTYDMGYCFVRIGLLLVLYAEIADPTTSPAVSNRQRINLMRDKTCVKFLL